MSIFDWSTISASNSNAAPGIAWPEGMAPSLVNDSARAMMSDVATWRDTMDPAGRIEQYGGSSAPSGWLECDGSAVDRTTYARLFTAISTTWGIGNGSTTFNLPDFRGRVLVGKGTGTLAASGTNADVDTAADTLTVASNNTTWITGMAVVFTLASGTITGLTSGNTYYVVRSSATLVKLASSLANAIAGTVVDMTAKSSPVWTITATLTTRTLAEKGGEETHALLVAEMAPITITSSATLHLTDGAGAGGATRLAANLSSNTGAGASNVDSTDVAVTVSNSGAGSGTPHDNMQPYGVTMFIIRT